MADVVAVKVQRTIFDLASFTEVTLAKEIAYQPVESTEEALSRLGGNASKFLEIINEGLRAETRRIAAGEPNDWRTLDDEGDLNGAFTGIVADIKAVNSLVLTLAKTIFGYSKDLGKEQKKAAKEAAMAMIKTNEVMKAGLQKSAALTPEES